MSPRKVTLPPDPLADAFADIVAMLLEPQSDPSPTADTSPGATSDRQADKEGTDHA